MPMLTDLAKTRLSTISFFLMLFLLSAWVLQRIWNGLRKDFPRLPLITYWRSVMFLGVWACLFMLVLSMIGGTREILTPGKWEKSGLTYKLVDDERKAAELDLDRRTNIAALKAALWRYADLHNGQLPVDEWANDIPTEAWETPELSRARYVYVPGRKIGSEKVEIVAYEPRVFPRDRLAVMSDGTILRLTNGELDARLSAQDNE